MALQTFWKKLDESLEMSPEEVPGFAAASEAARRDAGFITAPSTEKKATLCLASSLSMSTPYIMQRTSSELYAEAPMPAASPKD